MFRATLALLALSLVTVVALFESATAASPTFAPAEIPPGSLESPYAATARREAKKEVRADIKSMDILERPNRPGHFYGNTVRRRAARSGFHAE